MARAEPAADLGPGQRAAAVLLRQPLRGPSVHGYLMADEPKTYSVRVLVREVGYTAIEEDAVGNPVVVVRYGLGPGIAPHPDTFDPPLDPESQEYKDALTDHERGQIIDLLEDDYNRHKKYGVIRDLEEDQELAEQEADEELLDPSTATVEDLERWIRDERPTVNDVVKA